MKAPTLKRTAARSKAPSDSDSEAWHWKYCFLNQKNEARIALQLRGRISVICVTRVHRVQITINFFFTIHSADTTCVTCYPHSSSTRATTILRMLQYLDSPMFLHCSTPFLLPSDSHLIVANHSKTSREKEVIRGTAIETDDKTSKRRREGVEINTYNGSAYSQKSKVIEIGRHELSLFVQRSGILVSRTPT